MRSGIFLLALAIGTGAVGYLELKHQAEREMWRAETSRLEGRLERTERLAGERAQASTSAERDARESQEAAAELADLEARILDRSTELALLESDRAVAEERAATAIDDLKKQVRALTTIEMDMAVLDRRRLRLEHHVETVEERLQQAEIGAAERQKRAEALDRDIAGLAIRRETVQAGLETIERTRVEAALAAVTRDSMLAAALSPKEPAAVAVTTVRAASPVTIDESVSPEEGDRARGLYRFGSLPAAPELDASGQGGLPPASEDWPAEGNEEAGEDWAEDQYLMGLTLLSTAENSSGTRELSDAVLAFKAVLGEWPKRRDPMRWAIARNDLGYALALLGKRQGDIGVLEEAAAACREALSAFKRDETPLLWAAAQHHLGVSLGGLADLQDDQDLWQASIEALEQSIAAFKNAGAETDARKATTRLREAHASLEAAKPRPEPSDPAH